MTEIKREKRPCSDCGELHDNQRTDYPQGARVVAIQEFPSTDGITTIRRGTVGRVVDRCDDGRACISINSETHTFHFPGGYILRLMEGE